MAGRLKALAETGLSALLPSRLMTSRLSGRALVLAFHNVVQSEGEAGLDRSLHLTLAAFLGLIDALGETHRFGSIEEVETPLRAGSKAVVVITFDDAYRGAVRNALPELARRGIPTTVFVVPGRVGASGMWWDTVAGGSDGALRADERDRALTEAAGDEELVEELAARLGWRKVGVSPASQLASREELTVAARLPGVRFGSHSWSHPNLVRVGDARLEEELRRPIPWLVETVGDRFLPCLAYPYGLSDSRVEGAAKAAGYRSGFRVTGGWTSPTEPPYRRSRLNVPAGLSPAGMRLRGAGLLCR